MANKVGIVLNDEQIKVMDLNRRIDPRRNPDPEGLKNKLRIALKDFMREGNIRFQDHGANVWFGNIRIGQL